MVAEEAAGDESLVKQPSRARHLDGNEASRRIHDHLLAQQRRKEDFWLRKYGRLLVPPQQRTTGRYAGSLSAGPQRAAAAYADAAPKPLRADPSGPPAPNASGYPDPGRRGGVQLPQLRSRSGNDRNRATAPTEPGGLDAQCSSQEQGLTPRQQQQQQTQQTLKAEKSMASSVASSGRAPRHLPPLASEPSEGGPLGAKFRAGPPIHLGMPSHGVPAPAAQNQGATTGPGGAASGRGAEAKVKGLKELELELAVRKAIKSREDTMDRLRIACEKLDTSFGGGVPNVMPITDPMVRLLFRLVAQLRTRTLDVVETLAAWHRLHGIHEHYMYYGVPYMKGIGQDLEFLDRQPFLRPRLHDLAAVDDPFLPQLTPDGVPIEEATAMDLRRGGHRFTSEALRIRIARKVLAMYTGRNTTGTGVLGATSPMVGATTVAGLGDFDSSSLSSMDDEAAEPGLAGLPNDGTDLALQPALDPFAETASVGSDLSDVERVTPPGRPISEPEQQRDPSPPLTTRPSHLPVRLQAFADDDDEEDERGARSRAFPPLGAEPSFGPGSSARSCSSSSSSNNSAADLLLPPTLASKRASHVGMRSSRSFVSFKLQDDIRVASICDDWGATDPAGGFYNRSAAAQHPAPAHAADPLQRHRIFGPANASQLEQPQPEGAAGVSEGATAAWACPPGGDSDCTDEIDRLIADLVASLEEPPQLGSRACTLAGWHPDQAVQGVVTGPEEAAGLLPLEAPPSPPVNSAAQPPIHKLIDPEVRVDVAAVHQAAQPNDDDHVAVDEVLEGLLAYVEVHASAGAWVAAMA